MLICQALGEMLAVPVKLVLEVFLPVSARAFPLPTQAGDKSRGREERVSAEGEFRPIVLQASIFLA